MLYAPIKLHMRIASRLARLSLESYVLSVCWLINKVEAPFVLDPDGSYIMRIFRAADDEPRGEGDPSLCIHE